MFNFTIATDSFSLEHSIPIPKHGGYCLSLNIFLELINGFPGKIKCGYEQEPMPLDFLLSLAMT